MYYDPKWRSRYFRIIEKITFHIIAETITHFYRMRHRIIPYFHTGRTIDYFRFCRYDISLFVYKFKSPQLLIFRDQSITAMFKSDFYYILFQLMAFIQRACIQKTFFAISLGQSPVSKAPGTAGKAAGAGCGPAAGGRLLHHRRGPGRRNRPSASSPGGAP